MAELDSHAVVASYFDNVLLAFICRFLPRLLKEQAVCKDIYQRPEPVARATGIDIFNTSQLTRCAVKTPLRLKTSCASISSTQRRQC